MPLTYILILIFPWLHLCPEYPPNCIAFASTSSPSMVLAQPGDKYTAPKGYVCYLGHGITIDGKLSESSWAEAPWTDDFVDIEGHLKPQPRFRTRAKMLWDESYFYVAAEIEEPHVWATLTKHDSIIFHDNDFELFIDPDGDNHNYAEFEINALNTGWDLRLTKPYRDGGKPDDGWEIGGLKTAIGISGTLNNPTDMDRGWTVEIAIPWGMVTSLHDRTKPIRRAVRNGSVLESYETDQDHGDGRSSDRANANSAPLSVPVETPPRDGDQWRINFSRVEWAVQIVDGRYRKVPDAKEDNWVWSPQWAINMHQPHTWGYVQFSTAMAGSATARSVQFRPDPAGPAKHLLHSIYDKQHEFFKVHGQYARSVDELSIASRTDITVVGPIELESAERTFRATAHVRLPSGQIVVWHIRDDSLLWSN